MMLVSHKKIFLLSLTLVVAACATSPEKTPVVPPPSQPPEVTQSKPLPKQLATDNLSKNEIRELSALYEQPYIDPITDYLKKNDGNKVKKHVQRWLTGERLKRCKKVAEIYQNRPKNEESLTRLTENYNYSCPEIVTAFAKQVKKESADAETTTTPEITETEQVATENNETTATTETTPVSETVQEPVANADIEECYLLFAIRNFDGALTACEKAAKQDDAGAQHRLSVMYDKLEQSEKSLNWLLKAVQHGFANAQYDLGQLYFTGRIVEKDYSLANKWFRGAAEQGVAKAQHTLGLIYLEGKGVEPDYERAAQWFRQAAQQGEHDAQFQLGQLYLDGKGISKDTDRAMLWLQKAAEQGNINAQSRLGSLHENDAVLPQNIEAAYIWFSLAAAQGDNASAQKATELSTQLSPAQRQIAQQRVQQISTSYQ